ncbi:MAG: Crp/Fnr family transcriptional regulator [Bacillota bacterium]
MSHIRHFTVTVGGFEVVAAEITDRHKVLLLQTPLFKGLTAAELDSCLAIEGVAWDRFEKGEVIYHPNHYERRLGIILEGRLKVSKVLDDDQKMIMNILSEGNLVGGVTLFHSFSHYVVEITATTDTHLLFISQAALERMFQADYRLARNYISYLSSRIYFLNHKIERFTRPGAERKLLDYLADNAVESNGGYEVCLPYSMKDLAAALNISRASLYRVLDNLEKEGVIQREQDCISIKDISRLT